MFKKQAEMEARKIKRREQKEMSKNTSDPADRKDMDSPIQKKGRGSIEPPIIKRPRLGSNISFKSESQRNKQLGTDKEISKVSSGKKSVTDRKKQEALALESSSENEPVLQTNHKKVLSKALTYQMKKSGFTKFKEDNKSKKSDNKSASTKKGENKSN
jgi:hypothetical protein